MSQVLVKPTKVEPGMYWAYSVIEHGDLVAAGMIPAAEFDEWTPLTGLKSAKRADVNMHY